MILKFLRRLVPSVLGCCALAPLFAQPVNVIAPRDTALLQPLHGEWQFKYIAGADVGPDVGFHDPAFNVGAWKTIPVPSHWELHGFAKPEYGHVAEGWGLYRRTFRVAKAWRGQRIFLRFDGVLYGFEAWVNGRSVGQWASGYNPASFDITDALKLDEENILAVQVTTRNHGWDFDTNDCWALSGIYRDVTLFAVPATHLEDYTARTTLKADGSAELNIAVVTSDTAQVTAQLFAPNEKKVQEFPISLGADHRGAASVSVAKPQLWTAETPALYRLEIALQSGGKTVQTIAGKIGLRQVSIENGVLKLNGTPIKLRGVDHHDIWPQEGRVATDALIRRDLALIQAANINFVRTSHYPPHPRLLELCDELGLYVMDEVPFGFGDEHLRDPSYQDTLYTRADATIRRDKNHAAVIIWSVGNENPNTPLTFATGQRVKELDPTRPICFPQVGSYFERSYQEIPDWVDIYAPHYPVVKTLQRYANELKRPTIVTEYAHALGLATDRIQDEWEIMQASEHLSGGAVWMFQDQGILRTADKPTDLATPSLYAWADATHYYDTSGNSGMDGIVYSDRTPQTDYWQVRKVYSPLQIKERSLSVASGTQVVALHLENRFDFQSLQGLKLAWALQRNGVDVKKGNVALHAAPHASETVELSLKLPSDFGSDYYTLALRCVDGRGQTFVDRTLRLDQKDAGNRTAVAAKLFSSLPTATLQLAETPEEFRVTHPQFTVTLNRATGSVVWRDPSGATLAEGGYPHVGRHFTETDVLRAKNTPIWSETFLREATNLVTEATQSETGIRLLVRGKYARPGQPDQFLEGEQTLLIAPNGAVEVAYDYVPRSATGTFLEAGLSLLVPASASEFRWVGQGPFAGYPGKDRLNEFGLYHLNREDLNFQGNRREVNLALLTGPNGAGILLANEPSDIAVENTKDGTVLSHNVVLSGRGNKGVGPETVIKADEVKHIAGKFLLLPLSTAWPESVSRWFGKPNGAVPVLHPFYRSYDQ
jgi:beta-galactosidase